METPLHIKLLIEVEAHGYRSYYNASPFILKNFDYPPHPKDKNDLTWYHVSNIPLSFLENMEGERLIDINHLDHERNIRDFRYDYEQNMSIWYDTAPVYLNITTGGLKYLHEYRLTASNFEVNKSSLRNYKTQRWFSIATILVAMSAAVFSALEYAKPEPNLKPLERHIHSISAEINSLKQELSKQTTPLTSRGAKFRKRQPSVSNN